MIENTPEGEYETMAYEYMFEPVDIDPLPDNQDLSDAADDQRVRTANVFVRGLNRASARKDRERTYTRLGFLRYLNDQ